MNIENRYKEELRKLVYLKDVKKTDFRYSNILLFRDYQTRLYAWKQKLGWSGVDSFYSKKAFHNLFLDLDPIWKEGLISEEQVINDLTVHGVDYLHFHYRHYDGFFLSMFLNWELFKNTPEIKSHPELLHPYEPVFKLILRGGSIQYSESTLIIDERESYVKHKNNFMLPSYDEKFLNYIDENYRYFPNKSKVDELWENFKKVSPQD